jgi:hypothetical protein
MGFGGRVGRLGKPPPRSLGEQRIYTSLVDEHHYNTKNSTESELPSFASYLGVWLERNDRVFNRRESSVLTLMAKLKGKVSLWIAAGAKEMAGLATRV